MNHVYKLIWSRRLGAFVPVPEVIGTIGHGARRSSRRARRRFAARMRARLAAGAVPVALVLYPATALALPHGGHVAAGQATLSQSQNSLTVEQSSQKAIIDWRSFGIGRKQSVTFDQPGRSSVALNRVQGSDPSRIYGHLTANGQVFLVNPNGVTFARGAAVNVGGIVASTENISNRDFLAGHYAFHGTSTAGVVNQGTIKAARGGYVAFIGRAVDNEGAIATPGGTTALGAGGSVDLTLAGDSLVHFQVSASALRAAVKNGGAIIAQNGAVILTAQAKDALLRTVVNNTGVIRAQGVAEHGGVIQLLGGGSGTTAVSGTLDASSANGTGGTVVATGKHVVMHDGARVIATGSVGGGSIALGGGMHGGGGIPQAVTTTVAHGAVVDASATRAGNGGQISVWSDVANPASRTVAQGTFLAKGGPQGGNGGLVETSGHWLNVTGAVVNTTAPLGSAGTWLLDPYNVTIASNGASGTAFSSTYTPGTASTILNSSIDTALKTSNVTITTAGTGGSSNGDITVNAPISWTTASTLRLDAAGSITINAAISASGSKPGLALLYGQSSTSGAGAGVGMNAPVNLSASSIFKTQQGTSGAVTTYTIVDSYSGLQNINKGLSGDYALGTNLSLSGVTKFTPISGFTGIFDGLGHTISKLTIDEPGSSDVGLFGKVSGGTIRNVGLLQDSVTGSGDVGGLVGSNNNGTISASYATGAVSGTHYVGGLAGGNSGTISASYATGAVSGSNVVGGLVGVNYKGSISASYATGAVAGTSGSFGVGGLVGANLGGTISTSYATGAVTGSGNVGGLAGGNSGTISASYATGTVSGGSAVGGLAGSNSNSGTISASYATGTVTGSNYVGGLVGFNNGGTISASYATGAVSGGSNVGGLVGRNTNGTISAAYWDTTTSGTTTGVGSGFSTNVTRTTTFGLAALVGSSGSGFSSSVWANAGGQTTPYLIADSVFGTVSGSVYLASDSSKTPTAYGVITTQRQLQDINSTGLSGDYVLGNDLTAGGDFTPIGDDSTPFTGIFDGLGHTISKLTIDEPSSSNVGLFGYVKGGTIGNVGLLQDSVTGSSYVGGLVGFNSNGGTISASYATGAVSGSSGSTDVGGLAGFNNGTISASYATGTVSGLSGSRWVGGLVGSNRGTISASYATGTVSGGSAVGGLAGSNSNSGTISASYATGTVSGSSGSSEVGGLVGDDLGTISAAYWDTTTSGSKTGVGAGFSTGVTATTTSGLAALVGASGSGFSSSVWANAGGQTTPYLIADSVFGTVSGSVYLASDSSKTPTTYGVITTQRQLQDINSTGLSRDYVLGNVIAASGDFTPIGNASTPFTGIFDGLGYTISNLTINLPSSGYVGLFGEVKGGTIRNVGLLQDGVTGKYDVGGLVGSDYGGTVSASYATGAVSGSDYYVGGLVGLNTNGGTVSASYATGRVSGLSGSQYVGGLVGGNGGTISASYTTGAVSGSDYVGGLVGYNGGTISASYATGTVSGSSNVGGLAGSNGGTISAAYWDTTTSGPTKGVGGGPSTGVTGETTSGLAALVGASGSGLSSSVWANAGGQTTPYLIADSVFGTVSGSVYLASDSSTKPTAYGVITTQRQLQDINSTGLSGDYVLGNDLTASGDFSPIGNGSTPFTGIFDGLGHTISNLTIGEPTANHVGLFGKVSGGTIRNVGLLRDSVTGKYYVGGLVGSNVGTISASYATGTVSGSEFVGSLVGYNNGGTISASYATGTVSGSNNVGGLVGDSSNGSTISASYATGTVSGAFDVGGLVGWNGGTISASYATGTVSGSPGSEFVGSLVGYNNGGTISDAYWDTTTSGITTAVGGSSSTGVTGVTGESTSGLAALVGASGSGLSSSVWANAGGQTTPYLIADSVFGTVSGSVYLASDSSKTPTAYGVITTQRQLQDINSTGIAGDYVLGNDLTASGDFTPIGNGSTPFTGIFDGLGHTISNLTIDEPTANYVGLFGYVSGGTIRNVGLLQDSVTGSTNVGGLVGFNYTGTISASYATGTVTGASGSELVGGLVGENYHGTISASYATGAVAGASGSFDVGGLVGSNYLGTLSTSYATGTVSGSSNVGGLVGANYHGTISAAYWDTTTSGTTTGVGAGSSTGVTGLATIAWLTQGPIATGAFSTNTWVTGYPYPVLKALPYVIVRATPVSRTYGSNQPALTISDTVDQNGSNAASIVDTTRATLFTVPATTSVGTYAIGGSGAVLNSGHSGYQITYDGSLTITPKQLTASIVNDPTKIYDGTTAATLGTNNFSLGGFVTGQGATVTQTAGLYASVNAGTNDTVTTSLSSGDFTPTGSSTLLSNYTLPTTASGAGTITRRPLTASIVNDPTKTYDGTTTATLGTNNFSVSGFVTGQGAMVTQTAGLYASANAGTNDTVTTSLSSGDFTPTGSSTLLSNYTLPTAASGVGTITPKPLTASIINNPTKIYDGTTVATLAPGNFSLSGFVGDQGAIVTQTGTYGTASVGPYDPVTAVLGATNFAALPGTDLANYVLPTSAAGYGAILPVGSVSDPPPLLQLGIFMPSTDIMPFSPSAPKGVPLLIVHGGVDGFNGSGGGTNRTTH